MECITAQANLTTNTVYTTAFSTRNDTDTICVGTCRNLFDAIINSCDATVSQTIFISRCVGGSKKPPGRISS